MDAPAPDARRQRSEVVKRLAGELGFAACGICSAAPSERSEYIANWLREGRHGEMDYLARHAHAKMDPAQLLPGARSIIVVAWLYRVRETAEGMPYGLAATGAEALPSGVADRPVAAQTGADDASCAAGAPAGPEACQTSSAAQGDRKPGRIARYAWGRDYHRVIRQRLQKLADRLRETVDVPFESRVCVDTAPLLEREIAQRAGVGWVGVNCIVLNRTLGSYFCLGEIVTTLDLAHDEPMADGCGPCRRCLEACPTGAITAPYQMDPRLCISYLTIEKRGRIPPEQEDSLHGRIFGCDICQQVCPWNGPRAAVSIDADARARPPAGAIDPREVTGWSQRQWDEQTRGRALRRATLEMWRRNAELLLRSLDRNA